MTRQSNATYNARREQALIRLETTAKWIDMEYFSVEYAQHHVKTQKYEWWRQRLREMCDQGRLDRDIRKDGTVVYRRKPKSLLRQAWKRGMICGSS